MAIHPQYSTNPQVHSHIISSQGARILLLLWLKIPTAGVRAKCMQCRSLSLPNHNNEELLQRINSDDTTRNVRFTYIYIYIHICHWPTSTRNSWQFHFISWWQHVTVVLQKNARRIQRRAMRRMHGHAPVKWQAMHQMQRCAAETVAFLAFG
jgi:hypothetical protein